MRSAAFPTIDEVERAYVPDTSIPVAFVQLRFCVLSACQSSGKRKQ